MANRTVKVSLLLQASNYISGMDQAARKTQDFTKNSSARLAQQRQAFDSLGRTAIAVGAIAVAGVALAIAKFAEFDQAMSNVNAVTQETAENMALLRDAALEAGGRTIFTATEAANAIEELGKAGLSTADILGGALDGALDLAASGQLEVARAAEITATTLKQFGLDGSQAGHVADVLSAGAGKALGSVEDLAQGMKFVGPVAASMGVSLEETTGALALFADQGIIGEQAGTSLRGVLASLTSPSSQAAREIERLSINLYDAQGNFAGLENVAGQLEGAYKNLDDKSRDASLGIIFGNQQITAARVLFEQGGDAIRQYTADVNDSGYAARVAADRLDNLRGDLEKLGGAFDTVLIQQGSAANDSLRALVQGLTFLVDASGDLPPVAVNIGLVAAAVALAGGVSLLAVGKIAAFRANLALLGVSARTAAVAVGTVTAALTIATVIVGAFVARQADAAATTDALRESLDKSSGALTRYSRDLVAKKLAETGAFEAAEEAGVSQRELTDAVLEGGKALEEIQAKIVGNNRIDTFFTGVGIRAGNASTAIDDLRGSVVQSQEDFEDLAAANEDATVASERNANSLAILEGQAFDTAGAIDDLSDQILNFGKAVLDTREAERQFQDAIDDVTASVAENGAILDINTEAGRENEATLDALAEKALARSSAILLETGSQEKATEALAQGRAELILALGQFGITGQAAEDYADRLGLIPENISTAVAVTNLDNAQKEIDAFVFTNDGRRINLTWSLVREGGNVTIDTTRISGIDAVKRAAGGILPGHPSRVDNMLIAAASGEFVTNAMAASVPQNRAALEYMNAGGNISGYRGGGNYSAGPQQFSGSTVQVDMQVVTDDPYIAGELVKQQLAAKLVAL